MMRLLKVAGTYRAPFAASIRGRMMRFTRDPLCFAKNNKKMGAKNGTLADIEKISGKDITVRFDGDEKKQVTFNVGDLEAF